MILKKLIISLILIFTTSCVYTDVRFPLDRDTWETKLGSKEGTSSSHSVLWLVSWGDSGAMKAAKNGNIKVIHHLDMGVTAYFFGAYTRTDTIAYGD